MSRDAQRSGSFGRDRPILGKMEAGSLGRVVPRTPSSHFARVFLCGKPDDLSATSQRPISTKFGHETYFGVPSRNPHLTQSRLRRQITGSTAELFTPRCSPRVREFLRSGQLFSTTYGFGATGRQSCRILDVRCGKVSALGTKIIILYDTT